MSSSASVSKFCSLCSEYNVLYVDFQHVQNFIFIRGKLIMWVLKSKRSFPLFFQYTLNRFALHITPKILHFTIWSRFCVLWNSIMASKYFLFCFIRCLRSSFLSLLRSSTFIFFHFINSSNFFSIYSVIHCFLTPFCSLQTRLYTVFFRICFMLPQLALTHPKLLTDLPNLFLLPCFLFA